MARLVGGVVADKVRAYRETAAVGYVLSAACRIGFLFSLLASQFAFFLALDRVGKGIRTGPRDALLAHSVPHGETARAFGLHRSLDTAGAMLGPILGYWALGLVPGDYSTVFVFSLGFAVVGVFVLLTCTTNVASPASPAPASFNEFRHLLGDRSLRRLSAAAALLGLATLGDHVLYLVLQRHHHFDARNFPLLYIATPAVCMCLSYPLGVLADRWSRTYVLVGGYVVLLVAYVLAIVPLPTWGGVGLVIGLLGLHYAATDGVFMAIASPLLPKATLASSLSLLATVLGLGRLGSGIAFGLLWAGTNDATAVLVFTLVGASSLVGVVLLLCCGEPRRGSDTANGL